MKKINNQNILYSRETQDPPVSLLEGGLVRDFRRAVGARGSGKSRTIVFGSAGDESREVAE